MSIWHNALRHGHFRQGGKEKELEVYLQSSNETYDWSIPFSDK